jgi:hypothetical protein
MFSVKFYLIGESSLWPSFGYSNHLAPSPGWTTAHGEIASKFGRLLGSSRCLVSSPLFWCGRLRVRRPLIHSLRNNAGRL